MQQEHSAYTMKMREKGSREMETALEGEGCEPLRLATKHRPGGALQQDRSIWATGAALFCPHSHPGSESKNMCGNSRIKQQNMLAQVLVRKKKIFWRTVVCTPCRLVVLEDGPSLRHNLRSKKNNSRMMIFVFPVHLLTGFIDAWIWDTLLSVHLLITLYT